MLEIDRCGRDNLPQRFPLRKKRFTAAEVTIYRSGGGDLPQRFPLRIKRFTAALPMGCGADGEWALVFTRYCYYQYCMLNDKAGKPGGNRILRSIDCSTV